MVRLQALSAGCRLPACHSEPARGAHEPCLGIISTSDASRKDEISSHSFQFPWKGLSQFLPRDSKTVGGNHALPPSKLVARGRKLTPYGRDLPARWNETINWINHAGASGKLLPVIPEYALDMYTAEGQAKGRGRRHFFEEASRTHPEVQDRDRTYLERILKMLDSGELKD